MMYIIKWLYQILTGHYVQVSLAWVAIFYLLITVGYWLRKRHVRSESEDRKNQEIYVDQLNCLGILAVGTGLLFVSILVLMIVAAVLEVKGLPPGLACLTPFLLIAIIVFCVKLKDRFLG